MKPVISNLSNEEQRKKLKAIVAEDNSIRLPQVELRASSKAIDSIKILWHKYQVKFCDFISLNKKAP